MAQNDPLIGTTIDQRFKVLAFLGSGKSGSVYRAEDLNRHYTVALKFLEQRVDEKTKERFRHGVETASVLTHPNIVRLYSFHTTADQRPYFVTDCVQGINLDDHIAQNGPLSEQQAIGIFTQICDALDYAHAKGVVHRNLKPSNIMLISGPGDTFVVKIADFGVAKGVGEKETRQSLARRGEMLGNPLYMSPEQCTGQKMDGRADIYAAGCLLFETLTGSPPFKGGTSFDVMNKHLSEPLPNLVEKVPNLRYGSQLMSIMARATAKKPEERYQDAGDISRDLNLISDTSLDEWQAQACCMKPVELKPQKLAAEPAGPIISLGDILKPIGIGAVAIAVFIAGLVAMAYADPDVPSLTKYKVAVQEVVLSPKDPRLLKNLNYMTDLYKAQGKYAEAWAYKEKIIRATAPPPEETQQ